ncbi:DNRLRE domain-containing protein [Aestuariimicrobium ganziense]|uniref:DNRLRE domain-containing protein n=1 Tax=Aestuariimicrobium ganziense TaxID=2773677 RepID=UPI00194229C8|nr:DNRLRE domain-containing protein [Aestuariimicrobium ganziense]
MGVLRRCVAVVVALAVWWALLPTKAAVADPAPVDEPSKKADLVRPDWVSATVTARASGARVEVLSERTEFGKTWIRPDGVVDQEISAGPVQFPDPTAEHGWRAIDTRLVTGKDGRLRPNAVKNPVVLGSGATAAVDVSGALSLSLDGLKLPEPRVEGSRAVYVDVVPGVDVSVEILPAGFELLWIVKSKAAVAELVKRWGRAGVLELPTTITTDAAVTTSIESGALVLKGAKGAKVGSFAAPVMWDAPKTEAESRGVIEPVSFKPGNAVAKGKQTTRKVDVVASVAWLNQPNRAFPVMIDPTYASDYRAPALDTFVQQGYTTDMSADGELKLGNNGAGQVARTYMNFDATLFKGRTIVNASLSIFAKHSWSCTAKPWSAYDAGLASTATRWTAQPTIGTKRATSTETKGASTSCPAGRVSVYNLGGLAQSWSTTSASQVGMMLRADDETDPYGWKRFYSANSSYQPLLSVSYNRTIGTPVTPYVSGPLYREVQWSSKTPTASAVMPNDPDGNTVRAEFKIFTSAGAGTGEVSSCNTGYVAGGTTVQCVMPAVADNATYWLRYRVNDSHNLSAWSAARQFTVADSVPNVPTIACPAPYSNNSWNDAMPTADITCTMTLTGSNTSAPLWASYTVDGTKYDLAPAQPTATASRVYNFTIKKDKVGQHTITAFATSPLAKNSATTTYKFGFGQLQFSLPAQNAVTTDSIGVLVEGPANATSSSLQWRVAGAPDTTSGWTAAPATATSKLTINTTTGKVSGLFNTAALVDQADASGAKVSKRTASSIELKLCFTYPGGTKCDTRTLVKVPHAYGAGFPTTEAGPANVALWTGEVQVSDTDAEFNTPGAGLSVSRTFSSLAGPAEPRNAIFGPGWTAALDAAESDGLTGSEVYDGTRDDGTLVVESAEGDVLVFASPSGKRRTTATFETGTWTPVTDDTKAAGITLTIATPASASPILKFTDQDGFETTFTTTTVATSTGDAAFRASGVADKVTGESTSYQYDTQGRVTHIVAPLPEGISTCNTASPGPGCRFIKLAYSSTDYTSLTPGMPWRLTSVTAYNGAESKQIAGYSYNTQGRLVTATDSLTGLSTGYTYNTAGNLATITPPGEKPYTLTYATRPKAGDAEALVKVTRAQPDSIGGTAQLLAIYDLDTLTGVTGLDLTQFKATEDGGAGYGLTRSASQGFATFGPDRVVAGAAPAGADWEYASLYLTDAEGYTIHTANMGVGQWQLDATIYDQYDNVIKSWDARTTAAIRANLADPETNLLEGTVDQRATDTIYYTSTDPAWEKFNGTQIVKTISPIRRAVIPGGTPDGESVRVLTETQYDKGSPDENNPDTKPWLVTSTTQTVIAGNGTPIYTLSTTINGYDKVDAADPKTGWELRQPTKITTDMNNDKLVGTGDITRVTRYDARGRIIEQRQPKSAEASDAGVRLTTYYTGTGTGGCVNAAYAGLACTVGPKAQPAGQTLPESKTTGYNFAMQPTTEVVTSGAVTSTTTTTYDTAFRVTTTDTITAGLAGSTGLPPTTTTYDTSGRVATTSNAFGTVTNTYDQWGRQTGYSITNAGQTDSSTTTYDALGQVVSVVDNNGSTSYVYDGTDAAGNTERRGLVTAVTISTAGKSWTSTGAYDAQGTLTLEKFPGGIIKRTNYDVAGELIDLTWNGPVVQPDNTVLADQPWIAWSSRTDAAGRVVHEWMPNGQLGTTGDLGETVIASDRSYSYDQAGRLTTVKDLTGNPDPDTDVPCTLRTYSFDTNGNRTSQGTATSATSTCPTTATATVTRAYDTADRPTTGANGTGTYVYDQLGRQTTIPAADSANPGAGATSLAYYDNDAIASIAQDGTTIGFSLDSQTRRKVQTSNTPTGTATLTRHYTDSSDNPTWSVDTAAGASTTTRYAELISGDLGLTITTTGAGSTATLAVSGPRGDVTSEIDLPANATTPTTGDPATGLEMWNDYTEYGTPRQPTTTTPGTTQGIGYGWLGTKQRATTTLGLTLMGARLYNPASGLFTSLDPEFQGGDTSYGYPTDPVNSADLDGRRWWSKSRVWKAVKTFSSALGMVPGCTVCYVISASVAGASAIYELSRGNRRAAASEALGLLPGGAKGISWMAKAAKTRSVTKAASKISKWNKKKATPKQRRRENASKQKYIQKNTRRSNARHQTVVRRANRVDAVMGLGGLYSNYRDYQRAV